MTEAIKSSKCHYQNGNHNALLLYKSVRWIVPNSMGHKHANMQNCHSSLLENPSNDKNESQKRPKESNNEKWKTEEEKSKTKDSERERQNHLAATKFNRFIYRFGANIHKWHPCRSIWWWSKKIENIHHIEHCASLNEYYDNKHLTNDDLNWCFHPPFHLNCHQRGPSAAHTFYHQHFFAIGFPFSCNATNLSFFTSCI